MGVSVFEEGGEEGDGVVEFVGVVLGFGEGEGVLEGVVVGGGGGAVGG